MYKLLDCPELGYFIEDEPYPRGELAVKSDLMADGYYKDELANKEGYTEGMSLGCGLSNEF